MNTLEERIHILEQRLGALEANLENPDDLRVLSIIAKFFDTSVRALRGTARDAAIVNARFAAYHFLRKRGLSFNEIGALLCRDHTAPIHGVKAIQDHMDTEAMFARRIDALAAELGNLIPGTQPTPPP